MIYNAIEKARYILATLFLASLAPKAEAQELIVFNSENLKCNDSTFVFTPQGWTIDSPTTPALFLLHGWSGDFHNWNDKADIQAMSDKYGFIIITPDGFYNSWYLNNIDKTKMQWRDFFDRELYPQISGRYNLDPQNTFITGLSMGGHGAINIYIDDTTRFRASGSMSGVLDLHETRLKETEMTEVLGPYTKESTLFTESSAINRVATIAGSKNILLISCGYDDSLAESSREFAKECAKYDIPYILLMSPGNHSWKYWIFALDQHLFIFSKIANGEELGY